jgi:hypothetical protein
MQDALAYIDGVDFRRAMLQEAIAEPTRRGPDVCADKTGWVNRESFQRRLELFAATRDEARAGFHFHLNIRAKRGSGAIDPLSVNTDLPGHDDGLGFGARFGQSAFNEQEIKTSLGHVSILPPVSTISNLLDGFTGRILRSWFSNYAALRNRNHIGARCHFLCASVQTV